MIFAYQQKTGRLLAGALHVADGYSGQPPHVNDPAAESLQETGPIPRGAYLLDQVDDTTKLGPLAIRLVPFVTTVLYGRDGFWIHGDSAAKPGYASHGCIILPHDSRAWLSLFIGSTLVVV